jgi:hypothetical protein
MNSVCIIMKNSLGYQAKLPLHSGLAFSGKS